MGVGDAEATGVVQVQGQPQLGPARAHRTDHPLDARRGRPAHGVGEAELGDRDAGVGGDAESVLERPQYQLDRDVAAEVAAEGRHDADPLALPARRDVGGSLTAPRLDVALALAVQVDLKSDVYVKSV